MKRNLCTVSILAALALSFVVAGGSPQNAAERMMKCEACAPYAEYPQLSSSLRFDIFETATGYIASTMLADESLLVSFRECESKCDAARKQAMADVKQGKNVKLCPFCDGLARVKKRKDVKFRTLDTKTGKLVLATSSSQAGVAALHQYAMMARATIQMLEQAQAN